MTKEYRIAAVDNAVLVMEALSERPAQGVTELAARLGMTKSLVFRILHTLGAHGYVARDPDRAAYSLGYRAIFLGANTSRQSALLNAAAPEMDALREATSENVNLVVRDGTRALVVAVREGRHSIRLFAQAGRHAPLHAGGGPAILLAFAPEDERERIVAGPLERFTPHTVTDSERLRARLARIREQGWHVADSDRDERAFSVAAPVRDLTGGVVAAISVAGALVRFDEDRRRSFLAAVLGAAGRISATLGGAPGGGAPGASGPAPSRAA